MFSSAEELAYYLDSQSFVEGSSRDARLSDPITNFSLFSHGLENDGGMIPLGYNYSTRDKALDFTMSHIDMIHSDSFARSSLSRFYSCDTGTAGAASFAQNWATMSGGVTTAFFGKSDYTYVPPQGLYYKVLRRLWSRQTGIYPMGGPHVSFPTGTTGAELLTFNL